MRATVTAAGPKRAGVLRILLYHTPDLAIEAAQEHVDLYLCGHTHGGQIRLPAVGALFASSRFGRRLDRGLHRLANGGAIYTTPGVGLEGMGLPRARLFCPPEVTVLDVAGKGDGGWCNPQPPSPNSHPPHRPGSPVALGRTSQR